MARKLFSQWKYIIEDAELRGTDDGDYADWLADSTDCSLIEPTESIHEIDADRDNDYQSYLRDIEEADAEKSDD
jgi:hypothetical protein